MWSKLGERLGVLDERLKAKGERKFPLGGGYILLAFAIVLRFANG